MSKKIEMTPQQASLFSEMKKLSKQANQRILRLERYSGTSEPFATKQLADYLSSSTLNAWTKSGRVATKKGLTPLQMMSINKAIRRFLKEDTSRVAGAKQYTKKLSEQAGKKIPPNLASSFYKAEKNYTWIYKYMTESEFWDFARECVKNNYSFETFTQKIMQFIYDRTLDEELQIDLQNLYNYIQGVSI